MLGAFMVSARGEMMTTAHDDDAVGHEDLCHMLQNFNFVSRPLGKQLMQACINANRL
jgi:hypothetical protein